MEDNSDKGLLYDDNVTLKYILRSQILRIFIFILIALLGFSFLYYFILELEFKTKESLVLFGLLFLLSFRVENLRVLTLLRSIKMLYLVDIKDCKWSITDEELVIGRGQYAVLLDIKPVKKLTCYYDDKVVVIKPLIEFLPIMLEPLEV